MKTQEIVDLIDDLNINSLGENILEYYLPFEYRTVGWCGSAIYFMGVVIWSDENDEREYLEDSNIKEPLKDYLLRESFRILGDLNNKMKNIKKKK